MAETPIVNEKLRAYFEQKYGRKLSEAEILGYKNKLIQFFSLLIEIDQQQKRKARQSESIWNPDYPS